MCTYDAAIGELLYDLHGCPTDTCTWRRPMCEVERQGAMWKEEEGPER